MKTQSQQSSKHKSPSKEARSGLQKVILHIKQNYSPAKRDSVNKSVTFAAHQHQKISLSDKKRKKSEVPPQVEQS